MAMVKEIIETLRGMRIIDMTGEQFMTLISECMPGKTGADVPKYVYGIKGLARLLDCSDASAWRLKKSGKIDEAIHQEGDKIVIDTQKVLDLICKKQKKENTEIN